MLTQSLKTILCITGMVLISSLVGCKEEKAPIGVELYEINQGEKIEITALVDKITIVNIEVNNGNCGNGITSRINKASMTDNFDDVLNAIKERRLTFGQKLDEPVYDCFIREVTITTDQGNYTFTFDE